MKTQDTILQYSIESILLALYFSFVGKNNLIYFLPAFMGNLESKSERLRELVGFNKTEELKEFLGQWGVNVNCREIWHRRTPTHACSMEWLCAMCGATS